MKIIRLTFNSLNAIFLFGILIFTLISCEETEKIVIQTDEAMFKFLKNDVLWEASEINSEYIRHRDEIRITAIKEVNADIEELFVIRLRNLINGTTEVFDADFYKALEGDILIAEYELQVAPSLNSLLVDNFDTLGFTISGTFETALDEEWDSYDAEDDVIELEDGQFFLEYDMKRYEVVNDDFTGTGTLNIDGQDHNIKGIFLWQNKHYEKDYYTNSIMIVTDGITVYSNGDLWNTGYSMSLTAITADTDLNANFDFAANVPEDPGSIFYSSYLQNVEDNDRQLIANIDGGTVSLQLDDSGTDDVYTLSANWTGSGGEQITLNYVGDIKVFR